MCLIQEFTSVGGFFSGKVLISLGEIGCSIVSCSTESLTMIILCNKSYPFSNI